MESETFEKTASERSTLQKIASIRSNAIRKRLYPEYGKDLKPEQTEQIQGAIKQADDAMNNDLGHNFVVLAGN